MFIREYDIRWSEIDANFHLTSAAYINYITDTRLAFFVENSFSFNEMKKYNLGPIVLSEKSFFFKEVFPNDRIKCAICLHGMREDFSIITIEQRIFNASGQNCYLAYTKIAFLDHRTRRITSPNEELLDILNKVPKSKDFKYYHAEEMKDKNAKPITFNEYIENG